MTRTRTNVVFVVVANPFPNIYVRFKCFFFLFIIHHSKAAWASLSVDNFSSKLVMFSLISFPFGEGGGIDVIHDPLARVKQIVFYTHTHIPPLSLSLSHN